MGNVQPNAPAPLAGSPDDRATRIAREAAMIEVARKEVRSGLAVPEARMEQWFEQALKDMENTKT